MFFFCSCPTERPANPQPEPAAEPDAVLARQLEVLAELREMGLRLCRAVTDHAEKELARAAEGHAMRLKSDPGAAYARLAQSVRRTIALEVRLRDGEAKGGEGLFLPPPAPIDVHRPIRTSVPEPEDASRREAGTREPRERVADDIGRMLEDREGLIEAPVGMLDQITDELCRTFGLSPHRLVRRDGQWMVKAYFADPADPDAATPLREWRPDFPPEAFDWLLQPPEGPADPIIDKLCETFRVEHTRLRFRDGEWKVLTDPDRPDVDPYVPLRLWPRILPDTFEPPPDAEPDFGPPARRSPA